MGVRVFVCMCVLVCVGVLLCVVVCCARVNLPVPVCMRTYVRAHVWVAHCVVKLFLSMSSNNNKTLQEPKTYNADD